MTGHASYRRQAVRVQLRDASHTLHTAYRFAAKPLGICSNRRRLLQRSKVV